VVGHNHEPTGVDPARDEASLRVHAIPRFGRIPLAAIRQIEVRAWVADLAGQGLKPATVVKAYQLFGKVMAAAVDAGIIAQSPCRRIPLPKVEQDEKRFLTPAEIASSPASSRRGSACSCSSAPTAACASASWQASAAAASTPPAPR
jgi:hypothetical protein